MHFCKKKKQPLLELRRSSDFYIYSEKVKNNDPLSAKELKELKRCHVKNQTGSTKKETSEPQVKFRLRAKQKAFCEIRAKQKKADPAGAVKDAKYQTKDRKHAGEIAKRLMQNKEVRRYVAYLRSGQMEKGNVDMQQVLSDVDGIILSAQDSGDFMAALEAVKFKAEIVREVG